MMLTSIYCLIDPEDGGVRYIGKSTDPERRFKDHLRISKQTHTYCWIKSLREKGLTPIMKIIEICGEDWKIRERYWISYYKSLSVNLTNHSPGGDGEGSAHSEETKLKMSRTRKGKPPGNKGKPCSEEAKRKISEAMKAKGNFNFKEGFKHSEESKLKMSLARKGVKRGAYGKNPKLSEMRQGVKRGPYKPRITNQASNLV